MKKVIVSANPDPFIIEPCDAAQYLFPYAVYKYTWIIKGQKCYWKK